MRCSPARLTPARLSSPLLARPALAAQRSADLAGAPAESSFEPVIGLVAAGPSGACRGSQGTATAGAVTPLHARLGPPALTDAMEPQGERSALDPAWAAYSSDLRGTRISKPWFGHPEPRRDPHTPPRRHAAPHHPQAHTIFPSPSIVVSRETTVVHASYPQAPHPLPPGVSPRTRGACGQRLWKSKQDRFPNSSSARRWRTA